MVENVVKNPREEIFCSAEKELQFPAQIYPLAQRFEGLSRELANVWVLDVTQIPGCHYGSKNVFVPIIRKLEENGIRINQQQVIVSPDTAILLEPSTGNAWIAFSDAAEHLGYEYIVIMPDGLPGARYKHPQGKEVNIIRTSVTDYAVGMPRKLKELLAENPQRLARGEKIFVTPNHAVSAAEITIKTMAELGKQLLKGIANNSLPLRVVISMGNGASLCALGEYVKENVPGSHVVATESFAFGGGYDQFATYNGLPRYKELYDINTANPEMMRAFSAFGTNAPLGIELPLQTRAIKSGLVDEYILFTDSAVKSVYISLQPSAESLNRVEQLPNYSLLPRELFNTYGNSSLANIITASRYTGGNELVLAMVYDGRENYI